MIISAAVLTGTSSLSAYKKQKMMLHDHRPLTLNTDDYQRTCRIPHKKVFVVRFDKVDVFIYINIHLHIHTHTCTHKHI